MDYNKAKDYIIAKMVKEIKPALTYHNIDHTLDVLNSATRIAEGEKCAETEITLIKTAALYHDSGMMVTYKGHEKASVAIVEEVLPQMHYSPTEITQISKMILTTELPQRATSLHEKILCDADLDYLGRDDFFWIGQSLRLEWNRLNIKNTSLLEWYELQIEFMESHSYFTSFSKNLRNKGKKHNLKQLYQLLKKR
ncbi:MAG: HD domain-containing protein [Bacteroidales bacterium]|jgi:hypothetical protein|nr:HD domain-containing protein [Bacteroidales bacterium]MDD2322911.1 HD domain-containing protein [Bacteroidales bacterium]MDD3010223.1 HD domain-containing protein [Bacteroidales bacterium]MDD3962418.1 HD domain-containing protein [Bacteroidales bacterium]MDY0285825.1 HD domain-containing protein [Bacteroidales bacterium]